MTEEELNKWEEKLGFISYRTLVNNAYKEFETLKSENEVDLFINSHKNLFYIKYDINGEKEI
jgi:hypothetical protein